MAPLLGMEAGGDDVPAEAVPMCAAAGRHAFDFIAVGGLDVLVEENIQFAARLIATA